MAKSPPSPAVFEPTLLTPELTLRLFTALRAGNYRRAACAYAGLSYQTFYEWMNKGKEEGQPRMTEFRNAVLHAERESEASMVLLWRTHMKTDYKAIRDFLERRHPSRWSRRLRMEHSTEPGKPMQLEHQHRLDLSRLSDQDLLQLREIASRAQPVPLQITSTAHDALPD